MKSGQVRCITAAAFVIVLGLAASACASLGAKQGAPAAAAQELTLSIAAPQDGAQVSTPFEVDLDANVPLGAPETGQHHVHLYYDTPTPNGAYDLVYGNQAQVANLSPGQHTILASLRNANHSDAGPHALITVNVMPAADGSAQTSGGSAGVGPDGEEEEYGY